MKDEPLKDISEDRTKNMTANAIRQARYAGKMRAKGMKKLTLWVTPERDSLAPIRCDWCDRPVESLLSLGALWVCPECFGEAESEWTRAGGEWR